MGPQDGKEMGVLRMTRKLGVCSMTKESGQPEDGSKAAQDEQ